MTVYLLLPLLQTLFCLVLIVVVLKGHFRSLTHFLFSLFLLSLATWGGMILGMRASPDIEHAYSWERWLVIVAPFTSVLFYHFAIRYTATRVKYRLLPFLYIICFLFIPLTAARLLVSGMQMKPFGYAPVFGPAGLFNVLFTLGVSLMAFLIFVSAYRTSAQAEQKNRAAYIITAMAFSLVGAVFDIITALGVPLYPGMIIGNIIFCLLTTVAIVKHSLLDIHVVVRKGTTYILTSALIAIPFVAVFLLVTHFFKEIGPSPWVYFLLLIVLAFILPQLWQWIQRWVDRWFYRDRYDYLKALGTFSQETQSVTDSAKLGSTMVNLLTGALRTSSVHLLLPLSAGGDFTVTFSSDLHRSSSHIILKRESSLIKWLERSGSMLAYQDIEIIPQLQGITSKERETLQQLRTQFIIGLKTPTGRLSGLLILGPKLSEQPYTIEDKQLIYTISSQAAINLENARLYNESQQEVRERTRVEQALRESEEKYRALVENSPNLVAVYQDGHFTYVNKAACNKWGWTYEELTSPSFDAVEKLASEGSRHIVRENIAKRLRGEYVSPYELNMKTREGSEFPVLIYGGAISYGGKPANEYNFVDITELKQAEEQVRESEKRYRLLAESISDVIWTVDINAPTQLTYISPSVTRLLGYTVEEAMSKKMEEVFTPESFEIAMKALAEEMAIEGREQTELYRSRILELQMNCKDGSVVPVEVRYSFVQGLNERSTQILAIARGITERKRAEEELRHSHEQLRNLSAHIESLREAERTSIAREIHDELGQALTALKMDLSWLNKRLPNEQRALIEKIGEMSSYIGKTIQTVKRVSTELRPGVLDDLGLMAAVEWQVQEFQERTRIKCDFTTEGEDLNLDRDLATGVFRILQEALTNVARHANATKVKVRLNERDGQLLLQVRDNGNGIKEKQITHPKSFGLIGMRERARSWNGSVKIDGISGKGTTVTVSIPLNRKEKGDDKNTSRR